MPSPTNEPWAGFRFNNSFQLNTEKSQGFLFTFKSIPEIYQNIIYWANWIKFLDHKNNSMLQNLMILSIKVSVKYWCPKFWRFWPEWPNLADVFIFTVPVTLTLDHTNLQTFWLTKVRNSMYSTLPFFKVELYKYNTIF